MGSSSFGRPPEHFSKRRGIWRSKPPRWPGRVASLGHQGFLQGPPADGHQRGPEHDRDKRSSSAKILHITATPTAGEWMIPGAPTPLSKAGPWPRGSRSTGPFRRSRVGRPLFDSRILRLQPLHLLHPNAAQYPGWGDPGPERLRQPFVPATDAPLRSRCRPPSPRG